MYALNLAEDGRLLSVTYAEYAPKDAVLADELPEGNVADYLYKDGAYVYDPLPVEEQEATPTQEERIQALEEENKELREALDMILSGVTE